MSWICSQCETENSDTLNQCEVCDAIAPSIKDFSCRLTRSLETIHVNWKTDNCDKVVLIYNDKQINVTGLSTYDVIFKDTSLYISFVIQNKVTKRKITFLLQDILKEKKLKAELISQLIHILAIAKSTKEILKIEDIARAERIVHEKVKAELKAVRTARKTAEDIAKAERAARKKIEAELNTERTARKIAENKAKAERVAREKIEAELKAERIAHQQAEDEANQAKLFKIGVGCFFGPLITFIILAICIVVMA